MRSLQHTKFVVPKFGKNLQKAEQLIAWQSVWQNVILPKTRQKYYCWQIIFGKTFNLFDLLEIGFWK